MIALWQFLIFSLTQTPSNSPNNVLPIVNTTCDYSPPTLPLTMTNITYQIYLRSRLHNLRYYSKVVVQFECTESMRLIHLHGSLKHYTITEIRAHNMNTTLSDQILSSDYCAKHQIITLKLKSGCRAQDRLSISIILNGVLNSAGVFITNQTPKRIIIMGEPTNFRFIFPSFDDPRFRAKFQLLLVRGQGEMSTSNMIKSQSIVMVNRDNPCLENQLEMVSALNIFNEVLTCDVYPFTTYSMPTYLFTFLLADQEMKIMKKLSHSGVQVLWYLAKDDGKQDIETVLNETIKAMDFFEDYFNFTFPGRVMQNVRVNMGGAEGEELWNMVAYTNRIPPSSNTIAHEVAHHWFGNIATVVDWNSLWLKEGTSFYFHTIYTADNIDFISSRYKERYIDYPNDGDPSACRDPIMFSMSNMKFRRMYNWRRYHKPGSILHMVQHVFLRSKERMRNGFRKVIRQYYETTVNNEQFWASFDVPDDFPDTLENIISPWLRQNAVPIVFVRMDPTSKEILLTQHPHHRLHLINNWRNYSFPYVKILLSQSLTDREVGIWIPEKRTVNSDIHLLNWHNGSRPWLMIDRDDIAFYYVHYESQLAMMLINQATEAVSQDEGATSLFTKTLRDIFRSALQGYYDEANVVIQLYRLVTSHFKLKNLLGKYFRALTVSLIEDSETIDKFVAYMKQRSPISSRFDKVTFYAPQENVTAEEVDDLLFKLKETCSTPHFFDSIFLKSLYLLKDEEHFFSAINCFVQNDGLLHLDLMRNIYMQLRLSQYFARSISKAHVNKEDTVFTQLFNFLFQNIKAITLFGREWCDVMTSLSKIDSYNPDTVTTPCIYKMVIENALITCRNAHKYGPAFAREFMTELS